MSVRLGFLYFITVFAVGFVLGAIRVLWLVPVLGVRTAELIEVPVMITASAVIARWIVRRYKVPGELSARLPIGLIGLLLLLIAEFGVAALLLGQSVAEALRNRDPVSGTAYFISLGLFAVMPLLVARR